MKPIRVGHRGPAVEDVQRRLRSLGYDLGPTGVDGVFLNHTVSAVEDFRESFGLTREGIVDDQTWKLLVDATFTLGNRNLYLKHPFFHGRDVSQLQEALAALGFACGKRDGIFGAYTESGVKEFQLNIGIPDDGIAGDDTFAAIERLRHIWEGKEPVSYPNAHNTFVRAEETLKDLHLALLAQDDFCEEVARRAVNLAKATNEEATVEFYHEGEIFSDTVLFVVHIISTKSPKSIAQVSFSDFDTLPNRIRVAANQQVKPAVFAIDMGDIEDRSERSKQSAAVRLLDAFCSAFT